MTDDTPHAYRILGVDRDATQDDIKAAYKRLAQQYHPDRCKDANAVHLFASISRAYKLLSDPVKRAKYDETGDDNATDTKRAAIPKVARLITKYVQDTINTRLQSLPSPPFDSIKDGVVKERDDLRHNIVQLEKALKIAGSMTGKVKRRAGENMYDSILEDTCRNIQHDIDGATGALEIAEAAIALLEEFEAEEDPLLAAQATTGAFYTRPTAGSGSWL